MSNNRIKQGLDANDEKVPNPDETPPDPAAEQGGPSIADLLYGEGLPGAPVPQSDYQERGFRDQVELDWTSGQMFGELPVEDKPAEQQEAKSSAPAPTDNKPAEGEEVKSSPEAEDDSRPAPRSPR